MNKRKFGRRRSDIVGNESYPYGRDEPAARQVVAFKDRATDELAWRCRSSRLDAKNDRRKAKVTKALVADVKQTATEATSKNTAGTQAGYDPYESGKLVKRPVGTGRRNLRELGLWLKQSRNVSAGAQRKQ